MNLADFNARWIYPDQAMPPYTGGGILGGGEQQPSGILGGGGGLSQLLDPQVALPIAAQLIGGRNFQQSLSGAAAAAAQAIPDAKRRAALNAWIKAKSGQSIDPETAQLLQNYPDLAGSIAQGMLTPGKKSLQFSPMGAGYVFDEKTGAVQPVQGAGMGSADNLPAVNVDANGQRNPDQEKAFLDAIGNPQTAALVKGIADYTIDPTRALPQRGGQREYVLGLVRQFDPTYDMTQFGVRNKMRLSAEGGGPISQGIQSANMTVQHVAELKKAYDELGNTRFGDVNAVWNTFDTATGNEKIQAAMGKFNAAADAVSSELAKVFKGGGTTAEAEIKEWRNGLSPNMPPAQFNAAVEELVGHLLKARLDATRQTYEGAMGGAKLPFKVFKGQTPSVLQQLGFDPAALEGDTSGAAPPAEAQPAAPASPAVTHIWTPQGGLQQVK